jgi:hypothetical protein
VGLGKATTEFLIEAVERGARLDRTATIGRQATFVGPARLVRLLKRHGRWPEGASAKEFARGFRDEPWVIDPLLRMLGAGEITSIDASHYEGATVVHDLNEPLPDSLKERFSFVLDGGTLEHIFNAPVALKSYMEMVEPGGHLMIHTMANNCFGHGFYQFSPELFFRALSPANGYKVERVVVVENDIAPRGILEVFLPFETAGPWYEVRDPAEVGERVVLQNSRPVVIQVLARRVSQVEPFASAPQQSDYTVKWDESMGPRPPRRGEALIQRIRTALPAEAQMTVALDVIPVALSPLNPVRFLRERRLRSFRNRRYYRRVKR